MTPPVVPDRALSLAEVAALPAIGRVALVLGVFDGAHRGHRSMLAATREAAAARGARPVALVFDPPPIEVIRRGQRVPRLTTVDETLAHIQASGVQPISLRFDEPLRELSPEAFLDGLAPGLQPVAVVMTRDSAFGRDRAGTPELLTVIGGQRGFEVVMAEQEADGGVISSSRIRAALTAGDIGDATRLLGRPPSLTGLVVRGEGRGRELGYPTANLSFDYHPALPALGIYAGSTPNGPALISVGRRPTFHVHGEVVVEAHVLDWTGDLYGHSLRLELTSRLRDELRFASAADLVAQMQLDEAAVRAALAGVV